jgi:hypothetical protein
VGPTSGSQEAGQASVEWIGLVFCVSLAGLALAATAAAVPGLSLASELAKRLICAAGLEVGACLEAEPALVAAYGPEAAARVRAHAPRIEYEQGMRALPVDFRRCREDPCSLGPESGPTSRSDAGAPVTLFTHVIDCRLSASDEARRRGYDCSDERQGHVYLQFWAYYPGSQTARALLGEHGFHPDDWESYQLRLDGPRVEARASSHHGYNHTAGVGSWLSDLGLVERAAWGREGGRYYISGGSHAGHAWEEPGSGERDGRWTPRGRVRLIPLEQVIAGAGDRWRFAVTPPWLKRVWRDPEYTGTD